MSGNLFAILLSKQQVKAARQKCTCANCQKRPNISENYAWVATINDNYQREVIAKMEEEKSIALAKRRALIKMKRAAKVNLPSNTTNVTSSSSTSLNSTQVAYRPIINTAMNTTTTATSITTMTSSIRTPPTTINIPITRPLVLSSIKISERGLGSLPTTSSTTTISTRSGTACTTTTSTSTSTSTSIASIRPVVQWQVVHCPYSALSYLDRVIVTSDNNAWFQAGHAPCGNVGRNSMRRHM